jgi:hypothetical protein
MLLTVPRNVADRVRATTNACPFAIRMAWLAVTVSAPLALAVQRLHSMWVAGAAPR